MLHRHYKNRFTCQTSHTDTNQGQSIANTNGRWASQQPSGDPPSLDPSRRGRPSLRFQGQRGVGYFHGLSSQQLLRADLEESWKQVVGDHVGILLLLFLTFSVWVACPRELFYTVANPARGLINIINMLEDWRQ